MVGGGQGAFIGEVHRLASRLDGQWELVAGALSSNPERALASAEELGLSPDRSYASFEEMAGAEANRADGIDAVGNCDAKPHACRALHCFFEARTST